jgi:hypothetical protein
MGAPFHYFHHHLVAYLRGVKFFLPEKLMSNYSSGKGTAFFYVDSYIYSSGCELSTSWLPPLLLWFSRPFVRKFSHVDTLELFQ